MAMSTIVLAWLSEPSNLITLSLILLSIFISLTFSKSKSKKLPLPPSPPRLPLIGNLLQLGSLPHRSLGDLAKKHGPLMMLRLGQVDLLVITSPEIAKEALKTHDTVFASRPQSTAAKTLFYDCMNIGFAPYGDYWKQARKLAVIELLSIKRVQQFQCAREAESSDLVREIRKACDGDDRAPVDMSEMLIRVSNNLMLRCVLGELFAEGNGGHYFGELAKKFNSLLVTFCVGDYFPYLRFIDRLRGLTAKLNETFVEVDEFLTKLVEENETANGDQVSNDFVGFLLQYQKENNRDFKLSRDNLKAIVLDMFVGGSDTSGTTMEWIMAELMRNPNAMTRLQNEVRTVVGKKGKVEESDLEKMDFMKCVIKETLRLHPPAPLLAPRETTRDVEIGGYHVPAKTWVFVNGFAIQRDPKYWERPDDFVPERFEANSVEFRSDFQYIPFSFGRRGCPGMNFAVAGMELEIANLMYWFDWKLPSDEKMLRESLDTSEVNGLTVPKRYPLRLVPVPYTP